MSRKKIFSLLSLSFILLLSAIMLFACGEKEIKREYIANGKGSVVVETIDGEKVYRAVPDEYYEFVGWYDGFRKYSEEEVLTIKKSTPAKMEAHFATSAKTTTNRHLEGFYNSYIKGELKEGEYFNYSLSSQLNLTENEHNIQKQASINGFIDFNATSQFAFEVNDLNSEDFALYYVNNEENASIYIQIGEKKYTYADIGLLTNIFKVLPKSSLSAWNLDDFIDDENTKYLINQYFGVKNSMGFINSVENNENSSTISISYHKILNLLQNIADSSTGASTLQKLIHALTCEYVNSTIPEMLLTIKTTYQTIETREYVKDIELGFTLNQDYIINFEGEKVTIPEITATFKINTFNFGFSDQANLISNEILNSFPEATMNMINIHADGELDFLSQSGETKTIVDKYTIELDADLNPLALVSYKKNKENNYNDIEWEKLGFLSFKVSLVPETDETALKAQKKRHNANGNPYSDYINILIDTKNNGANVYFYLGIYSPVTLFTSSYIFNHSFHIPSLLNMLDANSVEGETSQGSSNKIMKILTSLVSGSIALENSSSINDIMYDLIKDLLGILHVDSTIIEDNFTKTDSGIELTLAQIRTEIRNYEQEVLYKAIGLSGWEIKLDQKLFGDDEEDNITHLSIKMQTPSFDTVVKNNDKNYLNMDGEVIIDNFNNAHKVLVGVNNSTGINQLNSPITLENLQTLKGSDIVFSEGILSDGSVVTTFENNKAKEKSLEMIVVDVEIVSKVENKAQVRVLLQFKDYPNSFSSIPMIGEEIYKLLGIPYGLILFETEVELATA